jgi:D-sedoheptulose 7-phosphate isomerase
MSTSSEDAVRAIVDESASAHQRFVTYGVGPVIEAANAAVRALRGGGKLLAFGNGGSAGDAEHFVAELVGRFETERRPLAAIALTAGSGVVTAVANDYGYQEVFRRQIDGLGSPGDLAFGISTSGRSANVEAALAAARARGLVTVALTGRDGGRIGGDADIHVNVAETSTARIQEVHRTVLHAICSLIDRALREP